MIIRILLTAIFLILLFARGNAQCSGGESEVFIEVITDDYGYEIYWELLPNGSACGSGTIFSGGNPAVGCTGAGAQQQVPGGYGNNQVISEGPFCLVDDAQYDIFWADDWGDGGASFNVIVEGGISAQFEGSGSGQVFTFTVEPPPMYALVLTELRVPHYTYPGRPYIITGDIRSLGAEQITSFDLNYALDGGEPVVTTITGIALASGESLEFFHETLWVPGAAGTVEVFVWASNMNGDPDAPDQPITMATSRVLEHIPMIIDDILSDPLAEVIAGPGQDLLVPRDLAFHPDPDRHELWVINKDVPSTGGSTVRLFGPGEPGMTWLWQRDPNAWHFMNLPTGIAFGDNDNFATCPGIFDANQSGGTPFTGPTLWSSDPAIYAQTGFGPLGSHLDMLHVNPECQGIAHDFWNRYWVVDGHNGDITMNDFRKDHGPGNSWHGDAIIRRYADFTITKDPNNHIVSHTVLDKNTGWLYVVDHGGQRVLRMDINTGSVSGPGNFGPWESYVEYSMVSGYVWEEIISTGLVQPAGIEVIGDRLLVSDHATGDIVVYDIVAEGFPEIGRIATEAGIMGITVGPDGNIWYVNTTQNQVGRVSSGPFVGINTPSKHTSFAVHPVPADRVVYLAHSTGFEAAQPIELLDVLGRSIATYRASDLHRGIDVSGLANGSYTFRTIENNTLRTARLIIQH